MENIRFGKPTATDTEVIEVAKLALADDFIRLFPDQYQTIVGERGVTVSGQYSTFRKFTLDGHLCVSFQVDNGNE